jgi:hypothetical protein
MRLTNVFGWFQLQVYDQTIIYDGIDSSTSFGCAISESNANHNCMVNFTFTEDVTGPVYVYYNLKNYYQNHRRYVKSRSALQLEGNVSLCMRVYCTYLAKLIAIL